MTQQNAIEVELGALKDDIKQLHADLSALAQGLTDEGKKQWNQTRKSVEKNAEHAYCKVADAANTISEKSQEAIGKFSDEVSKRPLTSFAAALGVGFLLGKILGRE